MALGAYQGARYSPTALKDRHQRSAKRTILCKAKQSKAKQGSKQALPTLAHAEIFATSKTYGWDGIYAEVGENQGWHVEDMVPVGHYIAISRDTEDFHFKVRDAARA